MTDANSGSAIQINSLTPVQGWNWLKKASWYYQRNPFAWSLALLLWGVMFSVLMVIPLLGHLSMFLLSPVLLAGFMCGAEKQQQGGDFSVGDIFSGFSQNLDQLILIGFFYLLAMIVVMIIAMLPMGVGMMGMAINDMAMGGAGMGFDAMAMNLGGILLGGLLGLALLIPVLMGYWFAPALALLKQVKAIDAIALSFKACVKNIIPFLVYGIVGFIVLLVAVVLMGAMIGIAMQADMWLVWPVVVLLGLIVNFALLSVFIASVYTAYKEIFA